MNIASSSVFRCTFLVVIVLLTVSSPVTAQAPNFDLPSFKLNGKSNVKLKIASNLPPSAPAVTAPEPVEPAIGIAEIDNMPIYMPSVDSKMPNAVPPVLDIKTLQQVQPQVAQPMLITPNPIKKYPIHKKVTTQEL